MNLSVHTFLQKYLKNKQIAGKNLEVREDDTFIVSYPKSGNTWMRMLIAQLLNPGKEIGLADMEEIIPDIYINSHKQLEALSSPRIIKSHECFDPRYRKVVYIVRDPRSICVSYYHHAIKFNFFGRDLSFDRYFELFMEGRVDAYGTWGENVSSWMNVHSQEDKEFLLIRYEDLQKKTVEKLAQVASFLGINADDEQITTTIRNCDIDRLRKKEEEEAWLKDKKTDSDTFFSVSKKNKNWNDYLSSKQEEMILRDYSDLMKKLNYV